VSANRQSVGIQAKSAWNQAWPEASTDASLFRAFYRIAEALEKSTDNNDAAELAGLSLWADVG
jgi:hypothetical protein